MSAVPAGVMWADRPIRVLVCGGRGFDDFELVNEWLTWLSGSPGIETIIHGAATGADSLAAEWAQLANVPELAFPADWKTHGRAAGPYRNEQMIVEGKPDLVIAFPGGRGTADMIRRAKAAGIYVEIVGATPAPHEGGEMSEHELEPDEVPIDPWKAFGFLVSKCAEGFGRELMNEGKTEVRARNTIIGCFLDFAAGEACRIARREGREPDHKKWTRAVDDAFERAVKRTATPAPHEGESE